MVGKEKRGTEERKAADKRRKGWKERYALRPRMSDKMLAMPEEARKGTQAPSRRWYTSSCVMVEHRVIGEIRNPKISGVLKDTNTNDPLRVFFATWNSPFFFFLDKWPIWSQSQFPFLSNYNPVREVAQIFLSSAFGDSRSKHY